MLLQLLISSVIFLEKSSLSTAKAWPASTFVSSATFSVKEPKSFISCFNIPDALERLVDLNELEQTSSAKNLDLCAFENFIGFIS